MPRANTYQRRLTREVGKRTKPQEKRFMVWDTDIPDLALRVYPSGRKSYVLRVTFTSEDGTRKQAFHTIGDAAGYADPEDARREAIAIRQRYKAGEDVQASERARRAKAEASTMTLRECLEAYLTARASGSRPMKASTAADMRMKMGAGLGDLMDQGMKTLTAEAVIAWHRERKLTAPVRADLEARYLRAVWNWSREEYPGLDLPAWPTMRWKVQRQWSPAKRRTRRLNRETAPAWLATTESWPRPRERALFLLLFYSGLRISEGMGLAWEDVDLDRARITLRDTKTREDAVTLPLARQAVAALRELPQDTPWVFPGVGRDGEVKAMPYPSVALRSHSAESGIEWAPHDLRRTFASIGTVIGVPDPAVRRLTNHKIDARDAHDGYIGFEPDELAPHVQRIADALEGMARGTRGAVVDLNPPTLAAGAAR